MNLKDQVIEFDIDGTLCLISYFIPSQACLFGADERRVVIATSFLDKGPFPWSCLIGQRAISDRELSSVLHCESPFFGGFMTLNL